eukprot:scaffold46182_cov37-Phaeocystis_antarctica.AAC.2
MPPPPARGAVARTRRAGCGSRTCASALRRHQRRRGPSSYLARGSIGRPTSRGARQDEGTR